MAAHQTSNISQHVLFYLHAHYLLPIGAHGVCPDARSNPSLSSITPSVWRAHEDHSLLKKTKHNTLFFFLLRHHHRPLLPELRRLRRHLTKATWVKRVRATQTTEKYRIWRWIPTGRDPRAVLLSFWRLPLGVHMSLATRDSRVSSLRSTRAGIWIHVFFCE